MAQMVRACGHGRGVQVRLAKVNSMETPVKPTGTVGGTYIFQFFSNELALANGDRRNTLGHTGPVRHGLQVGQSQQSDITQVLAFSLELIINRVTLLHSQACQQEALSTGTTFPKPTFTKANSGNG